MCKYTQHVASPNFDPHEAAVICGYLVICTSRCRCCTSIHQGGTLIPECSRIFQDIPGYWLESDWKVEVIESRIFQQSGYLEGGIWLLAIDRMGLPWRLMTGVLAWRMHSSTVGLPSSFSSSPTCQWHFVGLDCLQVLLKGKSNASHFWRIGNLQNLMSWYYTTCCLYPYLQGVTPYLWGMDETEASWNNLCPQRMPRSYLESTEQMKRCGCHSFPSKLSLQLTMDTMYFTYTHAIIYIYICYTHINTWYDYIVYHDLMMNQ